jgi:ATP-dependent RNA helicase MSS116
LTLGALRRQGIHNQTEIQEKTHDVILRGHNVLARSRTGTGKTLAFLVPAIERFLLAQQQNQQQQQSAAETAAATIAQQQQQQGIPILVLAPTRELAAQIGTEAEKLLIMHNTQQGTSKLSSQVVYGGSSKKEDIRRFQKQLPTILVATPGRLKDHL